MLPNSWLEEHDGNRAMVYEIKPIAMGNELLIDYNLSKINELSNCDLLLIFTIYHWMYEFHHLVLSYAYLLCN